MRTTARAVLLASALLGGGCAIEPVAPTPVATPVPAGMQNAPGEATLPAPTPGQAVPDLPPPTGEPYRNLYTQEKDSVPDGVHDIDYDAIPDAEPRPEPRGKYGNKSPYTVLGKSYRVLDSARGYAETGIASWYGEKFSGFRTSSMETYDPLLMTAAHKTLPIPSYVRVTHLGNNRSVVVRVNDRGPFKDGRIIDLSWAAAKKLGYANAGTARVRVEALEVAAVADASATPAATPAPAAGAFFVQPGAFALESSARNLAEKVRGISGETVSVVTGDEKPAPLNRVRVGPYPDRAAAERIRDLLRDAGLGDALVVPGP